MIGERVVTRSPLQVLEPWPTTPQVLRFATDIANVGQWSLDLQASGPADEPLALEAQQCVTWVNRWTCTGRTSVGPIRWHDEHVHWHFDAFALYELRRVGADNRPDFSNEGLVRTGFKASFCMEDTARHSASTTVESPPSYLSCTAARQGISPGWMDEYDNSLPGQDLEVAGLPDGLYALVITANPDRTLLESDYSDNVAWKLITLRNTGSEIDEYREES